MSDYISREAAIAYIREADALGMSYGQYVAAGLDQVAWEGHRQ